RVAEGQALDSLAVQDACRRIQDGLTLAFEPVRGSRRGAALGHRSLLPRWNVLLPPNPVSRQDLTSGQDDAKGYGEIDFVKSSTVSVRLSGSAARCGQAGRSQMRQAGPMAVATG